MRSMAPPVVQYVETLREEPAARMTLAVYLTMGLSVVLVIVAFAVAVDLSADQKHGTAGAAFAAIWSMLLMLALCVAGGVIVLRHRTPLAVGFLLGAIAATSQTMFVLFVLYTGLGDDGRGSRASDDAMATLCFLLFVVLTVTAAVLFRDRDSVVDQDEVPPTAAPYDDGKSSGRPPQEHELAAQSQGWSRPLEAEPPVAVPVPHDGPDAGLI